jgi:hypothetical protein
MANVENNGNPAQRLFDIVVAARRTSSNRQASLFWADIFDISYNSEGVFSVQQELEIISRVNQCRKLVDEVETLLRKNEDIDLAKYLRPFPKLKKLFPSPFGLAYPAANYDELTESDLTILEFCIDGVSKVYKEKVVDENDLKTFLSEIQSLYEQIVDSELDKNLKRILLDMLKIMENAIHEYRIRGVERLGEAIEQLIGIYVFNKEKIENSEIEEVGRVKKVLSRFGSMYSFAADTVQLLGAGEVITKLLGSGQ